MSRLLCYVRVIAKGKLPASALKHFLNFLGDSYMVAHNAKFDLRMINNGIKKYLPSADLISPERTLCTMKLFKVLFEYNKVANASWCPESNTQYLL